MLGLNLLPLPIAYLLLKPSAAAGLAKFAGYITRNIKFTLYIESAPLLKGLDPSLFTKACTVRMRDNRFAGTKQSHSADGLD